nr:bcl-2-binding component 3 isoform X1 [Globicephala melas]
MCECSVSVCVCASTPLSRVCICVSASRLVPEALSARDFVYPGAPDGQSPYTSLGVCVCGSQSVCQCVCPAVPLSERPISAPPRPGPGPAPPPVAGKPPAPRLGARRAPASPDLSAAGGRGSGVTRGRGVGPARRGRGGAGRGCRRAGPGSAGRPETRREPHASGCLVAAAAAAKPAAAAARTRTRLRPEEKPRQQQQRQQRQPLQLEQQQQQQQQPQQQPQRAALGGRALLKEAARPPSPSPPACSCPRGPQPSLSPAEQHLESPVPSAPGALAGGPTQAAPGVRGEEEQWAREIGAQLRRMADDLNALYERRRQEEQQRHRPSPWRVLYNLIMGLLPLPRGRGAPEMEPN